MIQMLHLPFANRTGAGRVLAAGLLRCQLRPDVDIVALPRGALPVGNEIAKALGAPLDVVVVRKLGGPWQPELAMGAIASGSFQAIDEESIETFQISRENLDAVIMSERAEIARRERLYRKGRPGLDLHGRTLLLVHDGLATGSTMLVALRYVRSLNPAKC